VLTFVRRGNVWGNIRVPWWGRSTIAVLSRSDVSCSYRSWSWATFRRAALERAFVQATVTGPWDALDREGILPPVAYLPEGTGFLTDLEALEAGDLVLREEHSYVPWGEKGLRPKCRRNGKKVQLSSSDS
jgi:hypothetical protein